MTLPAHVLKFLPRRFPLVRRLFVETARPHLLGYSIAIFFMIVLAGSSALFAWLVQDVVNQVFIDGNAEQLILLAGAVVGIAVARGVSAYGSTVTLTVVSNKVTERIQKRLFDHLLTLDSEYYGKTHSSELIVRMTNAGNSFGDTINVILNSFVRDLLTVIALVAVMVLKSPILSVIALLIGPVAVFGMSHVIRRVRDAVKGEFQGQPFVVSAMQEAARGIRVVKAFNLETVAQARMQDAINDVRRRANQMAEAGARTGPLMETLGGFAVAGVMLWAGFAAVGFRIEPGAFMSFITALLLAYEPVKRLANTQVQIEVGLRGVNLVNRVFDTKPKMDTNLQGPDLVVTVGEVRFEDVDFSYRRNTPVLHGLSFHAAASKVTALVGPSGAGKSTIMSLIERFYDVDAGKITIDGQDIAVVRLPSLRDQLALVSQDTVLFRATIRENIRFGRTTATDAEVEEAARNALAHDFIMRTKNGYDTLLDDGGVSLSGGERQRLAIARAMLREAPIVLLDEATSSLDAESEHLVQTAFDRLMSGRTTIVIAHRLSTVLHADKICVVVDGKIIEEGRHAELLTSSKHYARLYHLQFERHADADTGEEGPAAVVAE